MHKYAYRGPRPRTVEDIDHLYSLGIRTIVNLEVTQNSDEVMWKILNLKMRNYELENYAVFPPSKSSVAQAIYIMATSDDGSGGVYVHCRDGVDRTGYTIAKYRISLGWQKKSAVEEMKSIGMHLWFYWWSYFL